MNIHEPWEVISMIDKKNSLGQVILQTQIPSRAERPHLGEDTLLHTWKPCQHQWCGSKDPSTVFFENTVDKPTCRVDPARMRTKKRHSGEKKTRPPNSLRGLLPQPTWKLWQRNLWFEGGTWPPNSLGFKCLYNPISRHLFITFHHYLQMLFDLSQNHRKFSRSPDRHVFSLKFSIKFSINVHTMFIQLCNVSRRSTRTLWFSVYSMCLGSISLRFLDSARKSLAAWQAGIGKTEFILWRTWSFPYVF